jgi:hypothetical protein
MLSLMSALQVSLELIGLERFASRMKPTLIPLFLIASLLAGCTTTGSNPVADMPSWMGGLPAGAPPRPGTPAYDAWQAERAREAARPKNKEIGQ